MPSSFSRHSLSSSSKESWSHGPAHRLRRTNRVRTGDISIQVAGAKAAAVLGNVTTGQIVVPGSLQAPWEALCRRKRVDQLMLSRLKYFLVVTGRSSLHLSVGWRKFPSVEWHAQEDRHNFGHE
jgi:hypothetical protein